MKEYPHASPGVWDGAEHKRSAPAPVEEAANCWGAPPHRPWGMGPGCPRCSHGEGPTGAPRRRGGGTRLLPRWRTDGPAPPWGWDPAAPGAPTVKDRRAPRAAPGGWDPAAPTVEDRRAAPRRPWGMGPGCPAAPTVEDRRAPRAAVGMGPGCFHGGGQMGPRRHGDGTRLPRCSHGGGPTGCPAPPLGDGTRLPCCSHGGGPTGRPAPPLGDGTRLPPLLPRWRTDGPPRAAPGGWDPAAPTVEDRRAAPRRPWGMGPGCSHGGGPTGRPAPPLGDGTRLLPRWRTDGRPRAAPGGWDPAAPLLPRWRTDGPPRAAVGVGPGCPAAPTVGPTVAQMLPHGGGGGGAGPSPQLGPQSGHRRRSQGMLGTPPPGKGVPAASLLRGGKAFAPPPSSAPSPRRRLPASQTPRPREASHSPFPRRSIFSRKMSARPPAVSLRPLLAPQVPGGEWPRRAARSRESPPHGSPSPARRPPGTRGARSRAAHAWPRLPAPPAQPAGGADRAARARGRPPSPARPRWVPVAGRPSGAVPPGGSRRRAEVSEDGRPGPPWPRKSLAPASDAAGPTGHPQRPGRAAGAEPRTPQPAHTWFGEDAGSGTSGCTSSSSSARGRSGDERAPSARLRLTLPSCTSLPSQPRFQHQ
ncbi:basic salivary proline-rich protein 2-like [Vulpes lagopus]|uniref:basic salivary proline-rich protein 2-like n=1 Tax=Vulpes lagopus TaxID=494514 RepID=UPI001BCA00BF|nr:basic salivary proline-rich protein 2-like [Vulpes lagopus]